MLKGNRGEWSEVYAFLRILADGEIKPADANLNELSDEPAIPVIRVIREEKGAPRVSYYVGDLVRAELDGGETVAEVETGKLASEAASLYREITSAGHAKGAFAVPLTEEFMDELGLHTLKAPSADKADIVLQIHDVHTGFSPVCGWASSPSSAIPLPCSTREHQPISFSGSTAATAKPWSAPTR